VPTTTPRDGAHRLPDLKPVKTTVDTTSNRGTATTLSTRIDNLGRAATNSVLVRFLDNGQRIGQKTIDSIPGGRSRYTCQITRSAELTQSASNAG
jgi:CARDB protein